MTGNDLKNNFKKLFALKLNIILKWVTKDIQTTVNQYNCFKERIEVKHGLINIIAWLFKKYINGTSFSFILS